MVLEKFHEIPFTNKKVACRRQAMQRVPSNTLSIISDCTVRQVEFVADGKCNEELNIYPCNFDGGDCCNLEAMTSSCHEDVMSVMHNFVITTANTRIVHIY